MKVKIVVNPYTKLFRKAKKYKFTPKKSLKMSNSKHLMPEEEAAHTCTWMGFPSSKSIWGRDLIGAQKNIALIAKTISKYEPVKILVNPADLEHFQQLLDQIDFEGNYAINKISQPINDVLFETRKKNFIFH